ncbi:MAG TPA: hypothetical protein VF452_03680 [Candidatus Binatia bacterium]
MKSDIEKTIDARVAIAFEDILPDAGTHARTAVLKGACDLVRTVWTGKIYYALPKDETTVPEYFLDAELEQFLNEAIEESYSMVTSIAERAKDQFSR